MFCVVPSSFSVYSHPRQVKSNLFVCFQQTKVVLLEELACQFNLRTQDAIDRLQALQEMERITGISQTSASEGFPWMEIRAVFIYL